MKRRTKRRAIKILIIIYFLILTYGIYASAVNINRRIDNIKSRKLN